MNVHLLPSSGERQRVSHLLVTGASREEFAAALNSEASVVSIDFEDTVTDKAAAHALAHQLVSGELAERSGCRINPLTTEEGLRDLLMLREWKHKPAVVTMTKVSDPFEVKLAAQMLPDAELVIILETAQSIEAASSIAAASPNVIGLSLGGKDLSKELGCGRTAAALHYARGRIVVAAALAGVVAYDDIFRPFDDLDALAAACRESLGLGFSGRSTRDARQIATINLTYTMPL